MVTMGSSGRDPNQPKDWVTYLSQIELPVLAQSLREINELTDCSTSSIQELAGVILRDADLTSQVIRLSNTVFYNLSHRQVSTVSRAISLIGFETIKSIAISSLLIENLLGKSPRERLLKTLAKAMHAAVQARNLLTKPESKRREEVFIAALLSYIGELAFWCSRAPQTETYDRALDRLSPLQAQDQVLGIRFYIITQGLVRKWKLGALVEEVVSGRPTDSDVAHAIRQVIGLVDVADRGWESPQAAPYRREIVSVLDITDKTLGNELEKNAGETAKLVRDYGLDKILHHIPGVGKSSLPSNLPHNEPNPELQLAVLRDLSALLVEKPNLNLILQTAVEGVHRALGMPRVALLMLSGSDPKFVPKLTLGPQADNWRENFIVSPDVDSYLSVMTKRPPHGLISNPKDKNWRFLKRPDFDRWIGEVPGMYACLIASKRVIGVIYADGGEQYLHNIDDRFSAFCHFTQQAQLALYQIQER
ncbi:HDOD domain-containing protein [Hahella ganghwensis]|uniref:HDOD domain-containing protein n=1 Tax=Hahella ganghwensis TaxID=286420 RepID=UPI000688CF41|nr:HDOD domain-containing protein [Hahella ganghwensis]